MTPCCIKRNNIILDLWFGLPGTLEALDYLARDFFDASSNKDENGQKTLLEKARELIKEFVDKKEQKRFESIFSCLIKLFLLFKW
jgi:hypothetical protein